MKKPFLIFAIFAGGLATISAQTIGDGGDGDGDCPEVCMSSILLNNNLNEKRVG